MALAKTLGFAFAVVAVSVGVFLAARFHTGLHEVYAPRSARGEWGAAAFPGFFLGAWREARATLRAVEALAVGLEAACCQRFVRLQLRLLVAATLIAFCLMPIYAVQPAAIDPDGVLAADAATNTTWSALEVITLNHVPRRNDRVVCAGIAALVYALVYVAALGREWRRYHELKQRWSGRDGIQHATVLLTAEGDAPVDAAEVNAWLGAFSDELFGARGQVLSVEPLRKLRDAANSDGDGARAATAASVGGSVGGAAATSAASGRGPAAAVACAGPAAAMSAFDPAPATTNGSLGSMPHLNLLTAGFHHDAAGDDLKKLRRASSDGVCCSASVSRAALWATSALSDDSLHEGRFLVLLRSRRVAALLPGRWPTTLGGGHAAPTMLTIEPAPAPNDAYWPNLLRSRWSSRLRSLAGTALTVALYLFWTIPVTAVQALASVQNLAQFQALAWLAQLIEDAGPEWTAGTFT